jgi:hypothetical protein
MEAQRVDEQHGGFHLTDRGLDHVARDSCDDMFDTHWNLQKHHFGGAAAECRKNQIKRCRTLPPDTRPLETTVYQKALRDQSKLSLKAKTVPHAD